MKNSVSKSVPGILAVGVAAIATVLWLGTHRPVPPQSTEVAPESSTPSATVSNAPPVAEQDNGELPPVIPISLTNVVDAENDLWLKETGFQLVPHQPQEFGSVTFLMDGMIGRTSADPEESDYPDKIILPLALTNLTANGPEIIQRGSNVASVHLLGATRYNAGEKKTVAEIVWHYTDGTTLRTPVEYLTHFRSWVRNPYEEPAHLPYPFSKVVWTAPISSPPGSALRLYRTTFANPSPKRTIQALEFDSKKENPVLFIVGVTLDPLKPGQRPDLSPDLEPTDAVPAKQIEMIVQSADGQPLPEAKVQVRFHAGGKNSYSFASKITDASGSALARYPPQDLDQLTITASHDDYGSRKMVWDIRAGDVIPASYTLKLTNGLAIGGIVTDSADSPVADAKISLYHFFMGGDDMNKRGEQSEFSQKSATTDAQGVWQAKDLPPELINHVGFSVAHKDFLTTNVNLGMNGPMEKQLRAGTFKIVLQHGLEAAGRVVDDADNPISGATVWAGERYSQNRQQAQTDDVGKFAFHNVPAGDVTFSASAKGRAPTDKSITVKPDMEEILFRLGPGKSIRGVVQDDNGAPIPDVRVSLEGNGNVGNTYEFSATTDANGRFEWDSAPTEPMQFYFGKEGYESKRNVTLPPDQDNTVTLHNPRQLQGQVVDADSGEAVTNFSVRCGQRSDSTSDSLYGVIQNQDFSSSDGTFTLQLTEESENAIQVTSDDYAKQTQAFPDAQNGVIQMTIQLKPSVAIHGVVLAPDGTPAPGVSVAITTTTIGGNTVQLQGTQLVSWSGGSKVVTTDANGQFTLPSPPATGGIVVATGEQGFTSASVDEVRANPTLTLQAFGRIEGTLTIGGQPGVGIQLYFKMDGSGLMTDFNGYKTTTDDQGAFTFDQVPPGDGSIVRLVQTTPNSWTHSDNTEVNVKSGETTQVTLGDNGAVLNGTVRFESPPTNGEALTITGHVAGQPPDAPQFNTPAESQAYYQSAAWQAIAKQIKNYTFVVNANGTFMADDIAPGTYVVSISAQKSGSQMWMQPQIAIGSTTVTVPDSFSPTSPINVGEIVLRSPSTPNPN